MDATLFGLILQTAVVIGSMVVFFYNHGRKNAEALEGISTELKEYVEHKHKNIQAMLNIHIEDTSKKIGRIYERMDIKQTEYEKNFVRIDVHNITIKNLEEKTDEKFNQTIKLFQIELKHLTAAIDKLIKNEEDRKNVR